MPLLTRRTVLTSLAASLAAAPALADKPWTWTEAGQAIAGHDPVAYFTDGGPVRGDPAHSLVWQGAEWRFASAANLERFLADPTAHAPQYGGYCAWAVSRGYTAGIDPAAWRIWEGRLFLNYNRAVRARWSIDIAGNVARADANWPGVLDG